MKAMRRRLLQACTCHDRTGRQAAAQLLHAGGVSHVCPVTQELRGEATYFILGGHISAPRYKQPHNILVPAACGVVERGVPLTIRHIDAAGVGIQQHHTDVGVPAAGRSGIGHTRLIDCPGGWAFQVWGQLPSRRAVS
jgi:hypothetical protein